MQSPPPADDGIEGLGDPASALDHALEEQEGELIGQLLQRLQEGVPGDATVSEAMLTMRKTMLEDPQAHELLLRLLTLGHFGGRRFFECLSGNRPWPGLDG